MSSVCSTSQLDSEHSASTTFISWIVTSQSWLNTCPLHISPSQVLFAPPPLFVILVLMFCMVTLLFILAVPFVGPPPPCLWCIPISKGHRKRVLGQMLFLKETMSVGILALNIALNSGKQLSFTTITYKYPWDPCAIHCPHLLLLDTRFYSSSPHNVFLLVHGFLHISYTDRIDICLTL